MQNYNLEPSFIEEFIIDFKNKRAYWDLNPDFFTNILEYKELYESPYNLSFNLFEKLYSKVSFETYELSEEKINEFIKKFDFIESFPIYTEEKMYDNYVSLREFFNIYVTSYHPYGKKREYLIEENFPEQWSYFGELIEDLIGFDVLNIKDLKYLTSNINHDFKDNRFYKNDVELGIAKIKFKHYYSHIINDNDYVDMIFDFKEKTIKGVFNYNNLRKNLNLELSNHQILYIWESISSNKIFNWNDKDCQKGAYSHNYITLDGYGWRLDLQFDDNSILSFSGSNEHPDTYPFFAMDILNITGYDILRLDCISYEKLKFYKKYGCEYILKNNK